MGDRPKVKDSAQLANRRGAAPTEEVAALPEGWRAAVEAYRRFAMKVEWADPSAFAPLGRLEFLPDRAHLVAMQRLAEEIAAIDWERFVKELRSRYDRDVKIWRLFRELLPTPGAFANRAAVNSAMRRHDLSGPIKAHEARVLGVLIEDDGARRSPDPAAGIWGSPVPTFDEYHCGDRGKDTVEAARRAEIEHDRRRYANDVYRYVAARIVNREAPPETTGEPVRGLKRVIADLLEHVRVHLEDHESPPSLNSAMRRMAELGHRDPGPSKGEGDRPLPPRGQEPDPERRFEDIVAFVARYQKRHGWARTRLSFNQIHKGVGGNRDELRKDIQTLLRSGGLFDHNLRMKKQLALCVGHGESDDGAANGP